MSAAAINFLKVAVCSEVTEGVIYYSSLHLTLLINGDADTLSQGKHMQTISSYSTHDGAHICLSYDRYGSTENVGSTTRVWLWDTGAPGTVGVPHPNTEIKLVDVPEMGYTSEDKPFPRGEICLRGDGCFKEYYKGTPYSLKCL